MKLKPYENVNRSERYLRIVEEAGDIKIVVVDASGEPVPRGYLFSIQPDGTVLGCPYVNPDLGFNLDRHGCIIVK